MAKESLKEILPDFQAFLLSSKLTQDKNIPYNGIAFLDTFVLLHPSLKILEDFIK